MSTLVTRAGKGSPLTHNEVDTNFTNLNTDKVEKSNNLSDIPNETAAMANLMGFTSTATAAGTTTLTNTSSYYQLFTGSTSQPVVLPVTSTLQQGWTFHICNNSTGSLTVNTSGANALITINSGLTAMVTCIATGGTGIADWEAGFTDFSGATGTGGTVVLSNTPTISGILNFIGSAASNANFATAQTTGNSSICTAQTTGTLTVGNTAGTGTLTVGQSTVSQTTNIQAGVTASGSTKTIAFGTGGLTGSTTAISIGSTFGTSVTANGTWTYTGANAYGTPASITLTNATGLPLTTGVTGILAGVNGGTHAGAVDFFAMNSAPSGYIKANGAAVSRTTYAALFAAIGTTFGVGDGSTTFNVPDMRGYFARGWVDNGSVDSGRAFGSTQTDAFQGHKHSSDGSSLYGTPFPAGTLATTGGGGSFVAVVIGNPTTDGTNGTPRTASETRPSNVALLACIKF